MLATKRYEYLSTDLIEYHHKLTNHRDLNQAKMDRNFNALSQLMARILCTKWIII